MHNRQNRFQQIKCGTALGTAHQQSKYQKEMIRKTPEGDIRIISFCTPEQIQSCRFDKQFATHAQYKSIYTKRQTLEKHAAAKGANIVLALSETNLIVGFAVLDFPEPEERWVELGKNVMIEVRAIEVSRSARHLKIASDIIRSMLDHPDIENMIAYLVGYSWTWDLDGNKMSAQEYRNMMIHLFEPHGFKEFQTNEPNLCLKPENIFMGRIGGNVSEKIRQDFKWIRFGVSPA